jgi:hypothetical protein
VVSCIYEIISGCVASECVKDRFHTTSGAGAKAHPPPTTNTHHLARDAESKIIEDYSSEKIVSAGGSVGLSVCLSATTQQQVKHEGVANDEKKQQRQRLGR